MRSVSEPIAAKGGRRFRRRPWRFLQPPRQLTQQLATTVTVLTACALAAGGPMPSAYGQVFSGRGPAGAADATGGALRAACGDDAAGAEDVAAAHSPDAASAPGGDAAPSGAAREEPCAVDLTTYIGWRVFDRYCRSCHGADARGSEFAPSLVHRVGQLSQDEFYAALDVGYGGPAARMAPWGEHDQVSRYYQELWTYLSARARGELPPSPLRPLR